MVWSYVGVAVIAAAPFVFAWLGTRLNQVPAIKKIRKDYAIIDFILFKASTELPGHTLPGIVADAAYLIWVGRDVSKEEAREYAAGAVKHFSDSKYDDFVNHNLGNLDPDTIDRAQQIIAQIKDAKSA